MREVIDEHINKHVQMLMLSWRNLNSWFQSVALLVIYRPRPVNDDAKQLFNRVVSFKSFLVKLLNKKTPTDTFLLGKTQTAPVSLHETHFALWGRKSASVYLFWEEKN